MPRKQRIISDSGYTHIIMRGNGKQILFEEDADYRFFISSMKRFSKETGIAVCAYCLMNNHVHMLVYDNNGTLPLFMKKLGVSYAKYFNEKYERSGHLFQGRYLSESIDSERYLLAVFRYILNNPVKAGLSDASKYKWSSYSAFGDNNSFVDTHIMELMLGDKDKYDAFLGIEEKTECMEHESIKRDDKWAVQTMRNACGINSWSEIEMADTSRRNEAIRQMRQAGISVRQIERITGVGRGVIQRLM